MGGRGASSSTAKTNNKNDGYAQRSSTIKADMSVVKNITENYPSIKGNNRYYFEGAGGRTFTRITGLHMQYEEKRGVYYPTGSSFTATDGRKVSFKGSDAYDPDHDKTWATDDGTVHTTWKAGGRDFTNAVAARINTAAENLKRKRA